LKGDRKGRFFSSTHTRVTAMVSVKVTAEKITHCGGHHAGEVGKKGKRKGC